MLNNHGITKSGLLVSILIVAVLIVGGILYVQNKDSVQPEDAQTQEAQQDEQQMQDADESQPNKSKPKFTQKGPSKPQFVDECFEVTYNHKHKNSRIDLEAFADKINVIKITDERVNDKSICLKVNNTPVRHQVLKKADGLNVVFDSIAGPKAVVTAKYCTGKLVCKENCKVPRDEFLDAIGGIDDSVNQGKIVRWDPKSKNTKGDKIEEKLSKELRSLSGIFVDKNNKKVNFFTGWLEKDKSKACQSDSKQYAKF